MSHDDIWDDSALVASWNEALDEYKVRSMNTSRSITSTLTKTHQLKALSAYRNTTASTPAEEG